MAIVDKKKGGDWRISGKALDMLECFMSGLDDIIIEMALDYTRQANPGVPDEKLRIDVADIEKAANVVFDKILSQSDTPPEVKAHIHGMSECLKEKCRSLR